MLPEDIAKLRRNGESNHKVWDRECDSELYSEWLYNAAEEYSLYMILYKQDHTLP